MRDVIPILDSCTLTDGNHGDILVDHLKHYLAVHQNLIFPHRHTFYHFVIFTAGSGTHSIDFNKYKVTPWQIYFMSPGQVHTWNFDNKVDGYIFNFEKDFFQSFLLKPDYLEGFSFFAGADQGNVKDLPPGIRNDVEVLCNQLYTQVNINSNKNTDFQRVLLLSLLHLVEQQTAVTQLQQFQTHNMVVLRNFQKLVEENYLLKRMPKDYAEMLFITPNHLNAICKELIGAQAGEVIRERILLEAKRLLVSGEVNISQIANELNFNDNSYFTKFFKKYSGLTPEQFKRDYTK
ncbi:AraC family transcriptional regulator [Pedobacter sp. Leaf216]|uniref:AraC family transcriptional regulator n=1 Tax=Pedobacter sp. Leaf216 TaxID=1735684 RepID=UPI0006FF1FEA|nr:helix-turn-helix transcriptional regulator [Pedobacter sp. Leaf216]KQM71461.1 AraC family transcriptional regulator [Pedobacter sp. Leaf216]